MGKLLLAVAAAIASFIVAESLVCNKCTFGLFGRCINAQNETCNGNKSVCFTTRATFSVLNDFNGFVMQGCAVNNTGCEQNTTSTFLSVTYNTEYTCCNATDRCNPVTINTAPSSKMALSVAIGASILAFMFSM